MKRITLALGVALAALVVSGPVTAGSAATAAATVNVTAKEFKFTLSKTSLTDTPGANGGQLSSVLDLKVEDVTNEASPVTVYSGKVGAMGAQSLGKFNAGAARTYKFTITFPDGGTPSSPTTGDNAYKGSSMSVGYQWDAVS